MKNSASGPTNTVSPTPVCLEIGFGAGRGRARVAAVKLAGRGLDDVAEQDQHRRRAERIDIGRVEVGLQDHVGLVDRLPAGDRASVEHEAVGELVLVDHGRGHGQVLPLALGIGEAEVDPVDLLVLDAAKEWFLRRSPCALPSLCSMIVCARTNARVPAARRTSDEAISSLGVRDSPAEPPKSGGRRIFHRCRCELDRIG